MHVDESEAFFARLVALGEMFDVELSPTKQALYFDALSDLPLEHVVQALNLALKSCRFFPKPVELRELVHGGSDVAAERAWLEFRTAMRRVGGYADVTFEDAALANAIVGIFDSWEQACWAELSPEMWASKRKEFGRVYAVKRAEPVAGPVTLEGHCSRSNRFRYGVANPLELPVGESDTKLLPGEVTNLIDQEREYRERDRARRRENVARAIEAAADLRGLPASETVQ